MLVVAQAFRLTPTVRRDIDWLTRRRGDTSTACLRTVPCEPIRVESSRGPVFTMASTRTYAKNAIKSSEIGNWRESWVLGWGFGR